MSKRGQKLGSIQLYDYVIKVISNSQISRAYLSSAVTESWTHWNVLNALKFITGSIIEGRNSLTCSETDHGAAKIDSVHIYANMACAQETILLTKYAQVPKLSGFS